jgi:hypothetical protein
VKYRRVGWALFGALAFVLPCSALALEPGLDRVASLLAGRGQVAVSGLEPACPVGDSLTVSAVIRQGKRVASGSSSAQTCTGRPQRWSAWLTAADGSLLNEGIADAQATAVVSGPGALISPRRLDAPIVLACRKPRRFSKPRILSEFSLIPRDGHSRAMGVVFLIGEPSGTGTVIRAQGVKPNAKHNAYAVWLYNTASDDKLLGFVSPPVGRDGRLMTAGGLPANLGCFRTLVISLETTNKPRHPHQIILSGHLTLS